MMTDVLRAASPRPGRLRAEGPGRPTGLGDRVDRVLRQFHAVPGLDAGSVARVLGVSEIRVRVVHRLRHGVSIRHRVDRIRLAVAEDVLLAHPGAGEPARVRAAEAAGFRSTAELDRVSSRIRAGRRW
ncbi:hypothetical protein [Rathayibacter sp. VKM Ac-2630]|jgi:hypothetical protein|uniref:hypothetical protein n=1 Tax=Rathayibacter sp. VKM Ac-2630 TaxID=1938617 RepID=UPI001115610D|nr:hypothetical protein [Rathayibacter sp. VKM Ac-2630]